MKKIITSGVIRLSILGLLAIVTLVFIAVEPIEKVKALIDVLNALAGLI